MSRRPGRALIGRLVATLAAAGLVAACGAAPTVRSGGSAAQASTSAGARPAPPATAGFVRNCESSVYGELETGWRRESVVVGPLAFVDLREVAGWPADDFRRRGGGYRSQKVLVVVEEGATATVTVPAAARRHLALLYDPSAWKPTGTYRIADGDRTVTFAACRPAEGADGVDGTQFNGGFVVAGPRCATLEVSTPGWRTPRRVTVSFGAGPCRG